MKSSLGDIRPIYGTIGEKLIANFFLKKGFTVELAVSPVDHKKDMVINGKTVEVKTQVPFIIKKSFTFKKDQLRKCRNVDILYFIAGQAPRNKNQWAGNIYEVDPAFRTLNYLTRDGRNMILVPIDQPSVKLIGKIQDSELAELGKFTSSEY